MYEFMSLDGVAEDVAGLHGRGELLDRFARTFHLAA